MSAECHQEHCEVAVAESSLPIAVDSELVIRRHYKSAEPITVGWHAHDQGLLFAVLRGLATMQTETGTWTMLPRQIGWLPPGTRHCGHSFGEAEALFFYLRPSACRAMPRRPRVLPMSALSHALMERLDARANRLPATRVERLVAVLLDEIGETAEVPMHLPLPRDTRLLRMVTALSAKPDDDKDLDAWATMLGISRRTLIRRFAQETGLGISQWRQQLRLMKALELLAEGQSVTTASLTVGYSSVSAFIACFRQRFGVTPARYFDRMQACCHGDAATLA